MMKKISQDDKIKQKKLFEHCKHFIEKQKIHCAETIYQSDGVIENSYEFIEGICDIIGYYDYDE